MANFCLLPDKIEDFKKALAARDINISDLMNMSTEDRTKLFEKYAGTDAKAVNTAFESKLVLKNRMLGIQNLISKLGEFGKHDPEKIAELKQQAEAYKEAQEKRILSPNTGLSSQAEHQSFLNDLADRKLGIHVDEATTEKVYQLTQKMKALQKEGTSNLSGVSDEYLKARNDLNNFVDSQRPISAGKSILQNLMTIGRNHLLENPATPLKTIESSIVNSTIDNITRKISSLSFGGSNGDLAREARKQAWNTFTKTGINTAIMENMDDNHPLGKGENFKVSNTGTTSSKALAATEKFVQGATKISNKIAIDFEHNIPFTRMYQGTFYDAANVMAGQFARSEGLAGDAAKSRAADIFKDAARIEPQTREGALLRAEAQRAAARVTSTNDTLASNFSLGAKKVLNNIIPGVPLGDLVMPIAKIPASIVANGIDNAGAGIPVAIRDVMQGRVKIQSPDLQVRYEGMAQMARGIQRTARIAGVMGTAFLIASSFKKDDFRSDQYGSHFFRVGNTWINTEYLSAISPALAGAMDAKAVDNPFGYVAGVAEPLRSIPGANEVNQLVTSITNTNFNKGIEQYATQFFTSRGLPAFIPNLLKSRPIERLFFGANGVESDAEYKSDTKAAAAKSAAARKATEAAKNKRK